MQNIFAQGRSARVQALNSHYYILTRSTRDLRQISVLGGQMMPVQHVFWRSTVMQLIIPFLHKSYRHIYSSAIFPTQTVTVSFCPIFYHPAHPRYFTNSRLIVLSLLYKVTSRHSIESYPRQGIMDNQQKLLNFARALMDTNHQQRISILQHIDKRQCGYLREIALNILLNNALAFSEKDHKYFKWRLNSLKELASKKVCIAHKRLVKRHLLVKRMASVAAVYLA